ncbi:hypothetical protein [Flavobacterium sp.]|uniref:hypothetical protein n=1 Tax=Flavobacterium sp. TaxID=239 RepID=UPI00260383BD|nr:hypothetical protein [Flavobacterium sp.]
MEITSEFLELPLLFGIVSLVAGLVLYFFPPKKINVIYRYKTFNSMKSPLTTSLLQTNTY